MTSKYQVYFVDNKFLTAKNVYPLIILHTWVYYIMTGVAGPQLQLMLVKTTFRNTMVITLDDTFGIIYFVADTRDVKFKDTKTVIAVSKRTLSVYECEWLQLLLRNKAPIQSIESKCLRKGL